MTRCVTLKTLHVASPRTNAVTPVGMATRAGQRAGDGLLPSGQEIVGHYGRHERRGDDPRGHVYNVTPLKTTRKTAANTVTRPMIPKEIGFDALRDSTLRRPCSSCASKYLA